MEKCDQVHCEGTKTARTFLVEAVVEDVSFENRGNFKAKETEIGYEKVEVELWDEKTDEVDSLSRGRWRDT